MVIKSLDSKKPSLVSTPARVSSAELQPVKAQLAQDVAPDSGFSNAKKKLVNMTGRQKPVAVVGNPELAAALKGQVRVAQAGGTVGATKSAPKTQVAQSVKDVLVAGCKADDADVKAAFEKLKKAIDSGDFAKASQVAHDMVSGKADDLEEQITATPGIDADHVHTLEDQTKFLAAMSSKGVKASLPPTKDQLLEYFGKLKDDPKGARAALASYEKAFHVHPANAGGGANADVRYHGTEKAPKPPNGWGDVLSREEATNSAKNLDKQINDCEGYAFMAQELLQAAGFKLEHHLTANGGPSGAHAMAVFTHDGEKGFTLTSNDGVFHGDKEHALADQGFKYAGGKVTSGNKYYAGADMPTSQQNAGAGTHAIK